MRWTNSGGAVLVLILANCGCFEPGSRQALPPAASGTPKCREPHDTPLVSVFIDRPCLDVRGIEPFTRISVQNRQGGQDWESIDQFTLSVDNSRPQRARLDFASSYGRFQLHVIPALPGGEPVLCLRAGLGRGTEVRSETLTIYRLRNAKLIPLLRLPIGQWDFDADRDPTSVYLQVSWMLADIDGDGVAELLLAGTDPHTWTTQECRIYRWCESLQQFLP